jgi:hypothetical protein
MDQLHDAREVEAKEYHEKQKRKYERKASKSTYHKVGDKVVKKTKAPSGAVYSEYVGKVKECGHLLKKAE